MLPLKLKPETFKPSRRQFLVGAAAAGAGLSISFRVPGARAAADAELDPFNGYVTIAPALFDRYERGIDIGYTPQETARGRELKAKATTDAALRDIEAARDAVAGAIKAAVIGYCWGGLITWMSASRQSIPIEV